MIPLDWVEGERVNRLIRSIERLPGPRRTRLLAVAFCDRVAHFLPDDPCREWIEVARRYADKKALRKDMEEAHAVAQRALDRIELHDLSARHALEAVQRTVHPTNRYYADCVSHNAAFAVGYAANIDTTDISRVLIHDPDGQAFEYAVQLQILRDVLGRPDDLPSDMKDWLGWHGGLVPKLARGIYEDRAFDQMPVLGDALEDAGCTDEAILAHCRGPGPHVRGCWVVDLLLCLS